MAEALFKVGGKEYMSRPLNAFEAFEVSALMRNILMDLAVMKGELKGADTPSTEMFAKSFVALSGMMTAQERQNAVKLCLKSVSQRVGDTWSPIINSAGDLQLGTEMPEMIQIVFNVLEANRLIDFFAVSPSEPKKGEEQGSNGPGSQVVKTG